jgi:hypothetical protein
MEIIHPDRVWLKRLLFPKSGSERVFYHCVFWVAFLVINNAQLLHSLLGDIGSWQVYVLRLLYFLKLIPQYYLCVSLFHLLRERFQGVWLAVTAAMLTVLSGYLASVLAFLLIDVAGDLNSLGDKFNFNFHLYLDVDGWNGRRLLLLILNVVSGVELLFVPVGLKILKYGLSQNLIRQNLQSEALEMELKVLRSQLNPHFVFNVFNAAYAKILPLSESAAEFLSQTANILRFALYETEEEFVRLHKELDCIKAYVTLQNARSGFENRIDFSLVGQIKMSHFVPTFLLVKLVENTCEELVIAGGEKPDINISAVIDSDHLEFTVTCNGPSDNKLLFKSKDEKWLINTKSRLEVYFPQNSNFVKTEYGQAVTVRINLPLIRSQRVLEEENGSL